MAKNSRRHTKAIRTERSLIPIVPPGHKGTGNPLYDLNEEYGHMDISDPGVRAKIRRETKGQVDFKLVDGEWKPIAKKPNTQFGI